MGTFNQLSTAALIGQMYGFAVGTILSALLVVLVWRSGGAGRRSRFLFAACLLIADLSGLAKNIVLIFDVSSHASLPEHIRSIGFIAAAMLPLSIMTIWRDNALPDRRTGYGNALVFYSAASGLLIAGCLAFQTWMPGLVLPSSRLFVLRSQDFVGNLTIYNGFLLILLGATLLLPGTLNNLTERVAISLMIAGLFLSSMSAGLDAHVALPSALAHVVRIARFQSIVLVVIGALFYFSRFRAADIFAKQAMRLLVGSALTIISAFVSLGPLEALARNTRVPQAVMLLGSAFVTGSTILLYLPLKRWVDVLVERRIFGKRDTRLAIADFRDNLSHFGSKAEVLSATESLAVEVLAMKPDEVAVRRLEPEEETTNVIVPLLPRPDALHLLVSLAGNRRTLLTAEIESLGEIALHAGRRLDEIDLEEERMESVRLEGRLSQQLIEAELRALRAQINPHFLFNSLNTIAALISVEPANAEKFTLRLSKVFRYVLLHADRPLSAIDEEMDFLKTYLEIEQIRFGERLVVDFDVDASVAHMAVPSLILQPLVENALKHSIAPKVGKSRILVQAVRSSETVVLSVEDDGIGFNADAHGNQNHLHSNTGTGVGLQNVRERLHTMYGGIASLSLTSLPGGGSRATLQIPAGD